MPAKRGRKKLSYQFVKDQFATIGCQLVSKSYKDSLKKLKYLCECGELNRATWNHLRNQGKRCAKCRLLHLLHRPRRLPLSRSRHISQQRAKLFNMYEASRILQVQYQCFYDAIRTKQLPAPRRRLAGVSRRCYYNQADIERLQKRITV